LPKVGLENEEALLDANHAAKVIAKHKENQPIENKHTECISLKSIKIQLRLEERDERDELDQASGPNSGVTSEQGLP
jgi:hypothetical protein